MLFGYHTINETIQEYLKRIGGLVIDSKTLVFLDTNIIAYLYKLHQEAREEFFRWSDGVLSAGRLVVPAWAASEYLSRVTSKTLDSYTPKSKEPSQVKKVMDALHETASLFVDDALLRRIEYPGSRDIYLANFRNSIEGINKHLKAFSHQFNPSDIHQQVVEHLSGAILDSDLTELCARASSQGNARFEHRLPPGFRDSGKGENRFGDLIIWFEILDKAARSVEQFPQVIFVTNDEKPDWVYTPKMRMEMVAGSRKAIGNSNPEIKIADPRLVSEFRCRTNHEQFEICSLATLVEGLSCVSAGGFSHLAAAIQINIQQAVPSVPTNGEPQAADGSGSGEPAEPFSPEIEPLPAADEPVEAPPKVAVAGPAQPSLNYAPEALRDSQYQVDAPSDINDIIRALKSLNWYTQNPAIVKIQTIRQEYFTPSSWFVLGRNIYQAACGNSQKAMEFMGTLGEQLAKFPAKTAQHILAGMLFEIYFDAQGRFREKTKFSYADKPLALVADSGYEDARIFILFHLHDRRHLLKFMPGDNHPMKFGVMSTLVSRQEDDLPGGETYELRSITLEGVELMRPVAQQAADTWPLLPRSKNSLDILRGKVSEVLAIPRWSLTNQLDPAVPLDAQFVMPEGLELYPRLALQPAASAPAAQA